MGYRYRGILFAKAIFYLLKGDYRFGLDFQLVLDRICGKGLKNA